MKQGKSKTSRFSAALLSKSILRSTSSLMKLRASSRASTPSRSISTSTLSSFRFFSICCTACQETGTSQWQTSATLDNNKPIALLAQKLKAGETRHLQILIYSPPVTSSIPVELQLTTEIAVILMASVSEGHLTASQILRTTRSAQTYKDDIQIMQKCFGEMRD